MPDIGLTHVAFAASDLKSSIAFYERFAAMRVVHKRARNADEAVAWLSDLTRPFVIVLVQAATLSDTPLGPFGHLGVACSSRDEVDRLVDLARQEGCLVSGPEDSGPPVGYWAYLRDPDGNTLEIAFGQDVEFAVDAARDLNAPNDQSSTIDGG